MDKQRTPMWTTQGAIAFIREIHPVAFATGWNLHLGGGLATTADVSDKDVDVLAMPRFQVFSPKQGPLLEYLNAQGWEKLGEMRHLPHREVQTLARDGKVVELIFVKLL